MFAKGSIVNMKKQNVYYPYSENRTRQSCGFLQDMSKRPDRARSTRRMSKRQRRRLARQRRLRRMAGIVKMLLLLLLVTVGLTQFGKGKEWLGSIAAGLTERAAGAEMLPSDPEAENISLEEVSASAIWKGSGEEDVKAVLEEMAGMDSRVARMLEHAEEYPAELLELAAKNPEALDFVLEYPEKKDTAGADTVGPVEKGTIPLLLQWDERWGYENYGSSILGITGCGPTCLSMVISGLTGKDSVTPDRVAGYAEEKGYYVKGTGTKWTLMSEGGMEFGVKGTELPLGKSSVESALTAGKPIICSMRPGDFTTSGHFIVLAGMKEGKIRVNDPNSKLRSARLWTYEELEWQINNLWAFESFPL